jgi:hypothetical protein
MSYQYSGIAKDTTTLHYGLTLLVINTSGVWSFSKLSLVKNKLIINASGKTESLNADIP